MLLITMSLSFLHAETQKSGLCMAGSLLLSRDGSVNRGRGQRGTSEHKGVGRVSVSVGQAFGVARATAQ